MTYRIRLAEKLQPKNNIYSICSTVNTPANICRQVMSLDISVSKKVLVSIAGLHLKGLSHEIDFKNVDKNLQNLA